MVSFKKIVAASFLTSVALAFPLENVFKLNLPTPPGAPGTKPVPGDSPLVQCDSAEKQILTLQKVDLSPNPPERGTNLTISAQGYLSETIYDGAYVDIEVTYGYIKLLKQTFDLCEEITEVDMECPVESGYYSLVKEVAIPNEVPPGTYKVIARAYTAKDEFITCLTGTVVFPAAGAFSKLIDWVF